MEFPVIPGIVTTLAHWVILLALSVRIVSRRRPGGVSLAWITIIAAVPFVGAIVYMMVGELWLAGRRVRHATTLGPGFVKRLKELEEQAPSDLVNHSHLARTLDAYARRGAHMPTLGGNCVQVMAGAYDAFDALIADIDGATKRVYLMFYIWSSGGRADEVGEAVLRAAARGVDCRVLLDAQGSKAFLRSSACRQMSRAGVSIERALKVGRLRLLLHRIDMRNHRKMAAIDGKIGYCGSLNIADPAYFKIKSGVGPWVDVLCRVDGPAGEAIELTFQHDWSMESRASTDEVFSDIHPEPHVPGSSMVQLINSGPGQSPRATVDMLLTAIYASQYDLTLTTPYLIPTDSMQTALIAAALRGVRVRVVVPEKSDSRLVALASRSYYADLLEAGVWIWHYQGGLLHAKTMSVDDRVCLIGSANMDRRSFEINYESSVFIYDSKVTQMVVALQKAYVEQSVRVDARAWAERSRLKGLAENATQLVAPLL